MSRTWECPGDHRETIRVGNMPHLFLHLFELTVRSHRLDDRGRAKDLIQAVVDHLYALKSLFSDDHLPLSLRFSLRTPP